MPTQKAKAIDDLLTKLAGVSRQEAAYKKICTWCKKPITGFRNAISKREYEVSGFCQECQDKTYGED